MDCAVTANASESVFRPVAGPEPFWFELWRSLGWSDRVARVWSHETAFRAQDSSYLDRVLPTLTARDRSFVEAVIRAEGRPVPATS